MSYPLGGKLPKVCNCRVLQRCWIGEDPDFDTRDTIVAWHMDPSTIDGVEVAGCTIAAVAHVPGNILLSTTLPLLQAFDVGLQCARIARAG